MRCSGERPIRATATSRPISSSFAYSTPDGQVVSQARQLRQRSRCRRVALPAAGADQDLMLSTEFQAFEDPTNGTLKITKVTTA